MRRRSGEICCLLTGQPAAFAFLSVIPAGNLLFPFFRGGWPIQARCWLEWETPLAKIGNSCQGSLQRFSRFSGQIRILLSVS
jgi:hypothetical protein